MVGARVVIWVVGTGGLLGTELGQAFTRCGIPWFGTGREVDISQPDTLARFAPDTSVDWVINCAAYTAVDRAEDNRDVCFGVNRDGAAHLARWAGDHGAVLVHVSTDYVFSGTATEPYTEDHPLGPLGVYGASKAEGERAVRELCPRHYILRTAWLYGAGGPNFVTTMLRLLRDRDEVGVVADQWGTPTWTRDLADLIVSLVQTRGPWGTYHASAEGRCTWYDFAVAIRDEAVGVGLLDPGRAVRVKPLATHEYPTKAPRPAWSVLSKAKLTSVFGRSLPPWRESLALYLRKECSHA